MSVDEDRKQHRLSCVMNGQSQPPPPSLRRPSTIHEDEIDDLSSTISTVSSKSSMMRPRPTNKTATTTNNKYSSLTNHFDQVCCGGVHALANVMSTSTNANANANTSVLSTSMLSNSEPHERRNADHLSEAAEWRSYGKAYRDQILREEEEKGGSAFKLNANIDIEEYYALAERILARYVSHQEYFSNPPPQESGTCNANTNTSVCSHNSTTTTTTQETLEEYYKMGHRLLKFWIHSLPEHPSYYDTQGHRETLRRQSKEHIVYVTKSLEELSFELDERQFQQYLAFTRHKQQQQHKPPKVLKRIDYLRQAQATKSASLYDCTSFCDNSILAESSCTGGGGGNEMTGNTTTTTNDNNTTTNSSHDSSCTVGTSNISSCALDQHTTTILSESEMSLRDLLGAPVKSTTTTSEGGTIATTPTNDFLTMKSNIHLLEQQEETAWADNEHNFLFGDNTKTPSSSSLTKAEARHRENVRQALYPDMLVSPTKGETLTTTAKISPIVCKQLEFSSITPASKQKQLSPTDYWTPTNTTHHNLNEITTTRNPNTKKSLFHHNQNHKHKKSSPDAIEDFDEWRPTQYSYGYVDGGGGGGGGGDTISTVTEARDDSSLNYNNEGFIHNHRHNNNRLLRGRNYRGKLKKAFCLF